MTKSKNIRRFFSSHNSGNRANPGCIRFWEKVDRSAGFKACWPWMASWSGKGYGRFGVNGAWCNAHRIALEFAVGPPPVDKPWALHTCDNPICCNPRHLYYGSAKDNSRDSKIRDRNTRGERNGNAKLSKEIVLKLRREYALIPRLSNGRMKRGAITELARRQGLRLSLVWDVVNRKKWTHI